MAMACKHGNIRWFILFNPRQTLTCLEILSPPLPSAHISTSWRTPCLDGSTAASSSPTPCLSSTSSDACLASSLLCARFSFNTSLIHTFSFSLGVFLSWSPMRVRSQRRQTMPGSVGLFSRDVHLEHCLPPLHHLHVPLPALYGSLVPPKIPSGHLHHGTIHIPE